MPNSLSSTTAISSFQSSIFMALASLIKSIFPFRFRQGKNLHPSGSSWIYLSPKFLTPFPNTGILKSVQKIKRHGFVANYVC